MEENNAIVKSKENSPLDSLNTESNLSVEVAREMLKGFELIQDIVDKLKNDTRTDKIVDGEGEVVGTRSYVNPQLLKWVQEARRYLDNMWKLGGGELQHEAEKKKIEIKANLIMKLLGKSVKEREEMVEQWKSSTSFKQ